MALVCWFYWAVLGKLDVATAQAIALFAAALLFANVSDAISAVFNAFEKMEYPAGISTAIAVAKVALGALVLLPPLDMGLRRPGRRLAGDERRPDDLALRRPAPEDPPA